MTNRLKSGFPLYQSLGDACQDLRRADHALTYTEMIFRLLVKDTPFRTRDILEIHAAVQEIIPVRYVASTVRRRIYDLRKDGSIVMVDGDFPNPQDRVYQWTKTPAPLKSKLEPVRSVFGHEKTGPSRKDPALHFFVRILSETFV